MIPDNSGDQFQCLACTRIYLHKGNLIEHQRFECVKTLRYIECSLRFQCMMCFRTYNYLKNLRQHQRYVCGKEPGVKRAFFQCPTCKKRYSYRYNLNRHMKYECGDQRKFFCPLCPYKATQKTTLAYHVRSKHPEVAVPDNPSPA
ncbi:hypothetical protein J6590_014836 [Homalodisca vitripennis]|nr:hypothetical protein J6590_014836 [Homalodisca vitripennis]